MTNLRIQDREVQVEDGPTAARRERRLAGSQSLDGNVGRVAQWQRIGIDADPDPGDSRIRDRPVGQYPISAWGTGCRPQPVARPECQFFRIQEINGAILLGGHVVHLRGRETALA